MRWQLRSDHVYMVSCEDMVFKKDENVGNKWGSRRVNFKHSEESKLKMSLARIGKINGMQGKKHSSATLEKLRTVAKVGSQNPMWKGDEVGYDALHDWARRHRGMSKTCEMCNAGGYLELANRSREYKRDVDDWLTLCKPCHVRYDRTWVNRKRNIHGQFI